MTQKRLKSQLKEYKKNSELEKYGLYELPTFIKQKIHSQTIFHLCGGSKLQNIRQEIRLVFLMFAANCSTSKIIIRSAFGESANSLFEQFNFLKFDRSNPKI